MSLGFLVLGVILAFFMRPDIPVAESLAPGKRSEAAG